VTAEKKGIRLWPVNRLRSHSDKNFHMNYLKWNVLRQRQYFITFRRRKCTSKVCAIILSFLNTAAVVDT